MPPLFHVSSECTHSILLHVSSTCTLPCILYMHSQHQPSPALSPTDPVPFGQLWPTGPIYSLYTAYIYSLYRGESTAAAASGPGADLDFGRIARLTRHRQLEPAGGHQRRHFAWAHACQQQVVQLRLLPLAYVNRLLTLCPPALGAQGGASRARQTMGVRALRCACMHVRLMPRLASRAHTHTHTHTHTGAGTGTDTERDRHRRRRRRMSALATHC